MIIAARNLLKLVPSVFRGTCSVYTVANILANIANYKKKCEKFTSLLTKPPLGAIKSLPTMTEILSAMCIVDHGSSALLLWSNMH